MTYSIGKKRRLDKIFCKNGKALIVPFDDLLISGPEYELDQYVEKIQLLEKSPLNAVLGFPGAFRQFYKELKDKSWIINLSTSTYRVEHTHKRISLTLENAIHMGCDAVAVHVNITSPEEGDMIKNLGMISCECNKLGIPLMAIIYARKPGKEKDDNYEELKKNKNDEYTKMICHACRIAVELGADIIKTTYTGDQKSFNKVIYAAGGIPVVIAGGEKVSEEKALENAFQAIKAGASGVCFGRNTFYRSDILQFLNKLSEYVFQE